MDRIWLVAALWLALALVAVLAAHWLRIATALPEIVVGTVAQLVIGAKGKECTAAAARLAFVTLFFAKMVSKLTGQWPTGRAFGEPVGSWIYDAMYDKRGDSYGWTNTW